jgi:CheY-like chemotaxis protein
MSSPQAARPLVLLIDVGPIVRSVVKIYLARQPCDVVESEAAQALDVLGAREISLAIAELAAPGDGGLELVRKIRGDARPKVRSVPIVVLGSERTDAARSRALEAGASELLAKPVAEESFVEAVKRFVKMRGSVRKG